MSRPTDRANDYELTLNFLPIEGELPSFTVYRRLPESQQQERPGDHIFSYSLPAGAGDEDGWQRYWVSRSEMEGYESFAVPTRHANPHLLCRALFWALCDAAGDALDESDFHIPRDGFIQQLDLVQRTYSEGQEILILQPYHLRATDTYGLLADFHFSLADGVPFSRRIQQLSLSLDSSGRRNINYYADRWSKILTFLDERRSLLTKVRLPETDAPLTFADALCRLRCDCLRTKVYVFGDGQQSKSQYMGLKEHGPLEPLGSSPKILFVFREQDRVAARTLAMRLRGGQGLGRYTFPGFKELFKRDLDIDGNPVVLPDLSKASIEAALDRAKKECESHEIVVPVIVLPEDDESYLTQKSLFSHDEIASQVCTLRVLRDDNALKWALSNIALQVFCKAGGQPWKVRPTEDRSLIIGISQSHRMKEGDTGRRVVEKYFAFSVMTDNSGLFQSMQVLGEGDDSETYLDALRENLRRLLRESAQDFARVVIHTSFKLKRKEMNAIRKVVEEVSGDSDLRCRFAVVKVNHRCRFFGVNKGTNSLVPYEASRLKLGPGEYLLWFEGIFPDKTTVSKAFPGPTHIHILRSGDRPAVSDEVLLQDLVNLSGANWRGFNAKSAPVSVFYCHLVANLVQDFHERGLPLPAVKDIKPWFL